MEYVITTYGAGEVLTQTFNAIAALVNGKSGTLFQPLVRFALGLGFLWSILSMMSAKQGDYFKSCKVYPVV